MDAALEKTYRLSKVWFPCWARQRMKLLLGTALRAETGLQSWVTQDRMGRS